MFLSLFSGKPVFAYIVFKLQNYKKRAYSAISLYLFYTLLLFFVENPYGDKSSGPSLVRADVRSLRETAGNGSS